MPSPIEPGTVFLSYSTSDKIIAMQIASALENNGIHVWWDLNSIPLGANWSEFLSDLVLQAVCVVVLWSRKSIESEWVNLEAKAALRRRVLIPILIEHVPIPEAYSMIQSGSLLDWDGDQGHPDVQLIVKAARYFIDSAPTSAEETRVDKRSQRSAARRAEDLFQTNLRSESKVEFVDLENSLFYKQLSWNLNPGVNILLGRNGYGKTYLLRSMLALLQYQDNTALQTLGRGSATISLLRDGKEESIRFADEFFEEESAVGKLPILAIPDMRFINRSVTVLSAGTAGDLGVAGSTISSETGGDRTDLARYGASHFLEERPYEGIIHSFLYGLCLDYFQSKLRFQGEQFDLVRGVVRELTDRSFEFDRVAREGRDRFTLYVRTEGNEDNPIPIQKASQGTSSVIAMFGLIYEFLKSLRQDSNVEVRKRAGIVVIDEVDAHLHPSWQQKIVGLLRDRFPRVQFIITAHNPIVVAGCLEDEVSVLRRNSENGFSLVQFPNDFVGWEMDAIYRTVFGIENPDDSFAHFDAMRPFKGELEQQAADLAKNPSRNSAENASLDEIEEKLLYIGKVEQARSQRITREELERENRSLRDRVSALESGELSRSLAEAVRRQEDYLSALVRARRRASLLTVWLSLAVLAAIGLAIVAWKLSGQGPSQTYEIKTGESRK